MKKGDWVYIGAGDYLKVGSAEYDAHVQRVTELARAAEEERAERARAKQAAKAAEEEAGDKPDALINFGSLTAKVTNGGWRFMVLCFFVFNYGFSDRARRPGDRRICNNVLISFGYTSAHAHWEWRRYNIQAAHPQSVAETASQLGPQGALYVGGWVRLKAGKNFFFFFLLLTPINLQPVLASLIQLSWLWWGLRCLFPSFEDVPALAGANATGHFTGHHVAVMHPFR